MSTESTPNLAVFFDFENVAIGARDSNYDLDISLILERILDKGNIVVKKAYCDWNRYKSFKRPMHEAAFELIEIPHVSYSGKNSADIRLVVDALDLSYTKQHIDTFVIISGDSDFSPLVSKLRENAKAVIGVGVKNSSSDLLIEGCDEFIYYDDLERVRRRSPSRSKSKGRRGGRGRGRDKSAPQTGEQPALSVSHRDAPKAEKPSEAKPSAAEAQGEKSEALELVLDVIERLFEDRNGQLWGSMVKQVLKRKRPQFSEGYYGFRSFNQLLKHAEEEKLLELQRDDKSGGYLVVGFGPKA